MRLGEEKEMKMESFCVPDGSFVFAVVLYALQKRKERERVEGKRELSHFFFNVCICISTFECTFVLGKIAPLVVNLLFHSKLIFNF